MGKVFFCLYEAFFFLGSQKWTTSLIYFTVKIPFYKKIFNIRARLLTEIAQKSLLRGIFLICHVYFYFFQVHVILSDSMSPYLQKGDIIFVECFSMGFPIPITNFTGRKIYRFLTLRELKVNDVVLVSLENSANLVVKRIHEIFPDGSISLRGDNIKNSYDSRHFGNIRKTAVRGRVFYFVKR